MTQQCKLQPPKGARGLLRGNADNLNTYITNSVFAAVTGVAQDLLEARSGLCQASFCVHAAPVEPRCDAAELRGCCAVRAALAAVELPCWLSLLSVTSQSLKNSADYIFLPNELNESEDGLRLPQRMVFRPQPELEETSAQSTDIAWKHHGSKELGIKKAACCMTEIQRCTRRAGTTTVCMPFKRTYTGARPKLSH